MKLKLKVLKKEDTPENCTRRIVLEHDENGEWCRDNQDCLFMLWSNSRNHRGDTVWDPISKKRVEVDSPLEEIEDKDGYGTGEYRVKPGIIAFGVDVYEHSGTAWALHGEGGCCFSCPWDTARNAFYLYVDKERWESLGPIEKWEFVDGKPTEALLKRARELARCEINEMNLCEQGAYYSYTEQLLIREHQIVKTLKWDGTVEDVSERDVRDWDDGDSCSGFLTDKPAQDVDFPAGCPVVTDEQYVVGDTFEQECWALKDDATGKYLAISYENGLPKHRLVDDPAFATLWGCREFPSTNRKAYENDHKKALTVVDVTEEVWCRWPECIA